MKDHNKSMLTVHRDIMLLSMSYYEIYKVLATYLPLTMFS